ncbi:hypothetical protein TNCV_4361631 [Trichonephila clavipes]|nr:hypothetical protein TNCV_4361631 [Trichonephila clavipes]
MGGFIYVESTGKHYMYGRANNNGRAALRMSHTQFSDQRMPDDIIFNFYTVNFMKQVGSTSSGMVPVNEELFAVQVWKKAS